MSVTASTLATLRSLVGGRWWPLTWLLTRLLLLLLLAAPFRWVTGDLHYFADSLDRLAWVGLDETLVEYPLPGVALLAFPWLVVQALLQDAAYVGTVVALAVGTDAAFALLLHRYAGPSGRAAAVGAWVLAVPLLGVTAYARFDLVPGVLAGGALLLLARHPRVAAAGAVAATGLKVWPALLLPALAAPRAVRSRVVAVTALLGTLLVGASVLVAGWDRLVSPLTWQSDRGLQVEAVAATPAMLGWALAPDRYAVEFGDANAYEVAGPGVGALLAAGDLATLLLLATLALLWWRAWRGPEPTSGLVVWSALLAVSGLVVTSKVLSPQYLLWLLPLAAAGLAVAPSARLARWTVALLVAAGLTQLVFPVLYEAVVMELPWTGAAVLVLAVRNALLAGLVVAAARAAFAEAGRPAPGPLSGAGRWSASRPVRRAPDGGPAGAGPATPA